MGKMKENGHCGNVLEKARAITGISPRRFGFPYAIIPMRNYYSTGFKPGVEWRVNRQGLLCGTKASYFALASLSPEQFSGLFKKNFG
jgi:hypothetical protein